jgi:hypothetical protein
VYSLRGSDATWMGKRYFIALQHPVLGLVDRQERNDLHIGGDVLRRAEASI